jgi:endoglucanase
VNIFSKKATCRSLLLHSVIWVMIGGSYAVRAAESHALIRVNQVGYLINAGKQARLMATVPESGATFKVVGADGMTAFTASIGKNAGSWNPANPVVYELDFSAVKTPGTYSIRVEGPVPAVSPSFKIGTGKELFTPLLRNALFFFQAQRDGADVSSSVLNRQPSHLSDKQAFVYQVPTFGKEGMQGGLEKIGGPLDVSGGWFDAGDYLKFVETASYVTAILLQTARDDPAQSGPRGADIAAEGRFGLDWLLKMWNDDTKTLYAQVGLGDGNDIVTGDHDIWRLPEADDRLEVKPGDPDYHLKCRPVFASGAAGEKISPNLAGRLAAAFALGYQVFKVSDPAYAQKLLLAAEHVYDLADTTRTGALTSAYPHDFYPEDEWRDDMEWGAVELHLAVAGQKSSTDAARYLRDAAHWAHDYLSSDSDDTLNLYDVSSLAHAELYRAMEKAGDPQSLEVTRDALLAGLKKQLDRALKHSESDPFGLGVPYSTSDLVPHVLGLVIEAGLYDDLTHTTTFADFARRQLDFTLGANAWGTSFIVGAGKIFPFHMQHQVANLAGSLDGTSPLLLGATVDGPAPGRSSHDDGAPDGARPTPWPGGKNPFAAFSGHGVHYIDDVRSWATVEPTDDYTVPTVMIFAQLANQP